MKSEKETIMNYDEIVKRIGIQEDTILGVYMYGSRVYDNFRKNSDHDFIVILANGFKTEEQYSDNLINVNFYTQNEHRDRVVSCEPSALEVAFLPKEFILHDWQAGMHSNETANMKNKYKLDSLRRSFSEKSSNSWVKAKKKLTVPESYNDLVGKKSLWHAIRIIDFGIQIATHGKIVDYGSCNYFYDEVMYCNDWSELFEKYKKQYNEICTQFRLVAPKLKEDE